MASPSPQTLTLLLSKADVFIWGFAYQLGSVRRNIDELKAAGLLLSEASDLRKVGYEHNFGLGGDESLLSLSAKPFQEILTRCPQPQALVVHHSFTTSAVLPQEQPAGGGFMPYAQYLPAALLRQFDMDHVPYFGSFATGCTGLLSLIMTASGTCAYSGRGPSVCFTTDVKPPRSSYDAPRERILISDCSSGFLIGHENRGYQVLGVSYYSTRRALVPLVEIVKRTVQMVRDLASALNIDFAETDAVLHFPNIFPTAWQMVRSYLPFAQDPRSLEGLGERAHCLSSDPIITLAARHGGRGGRFHVVVNFGSGLHLGVGIFREEILS